MGGLNWASVAQTGITVFAAGYALLWWWVSQPRESSNLTEIGADFIEGLAMAPMMVLVASILFPAIGNYVANHDAAIIVGASVVAVLALIDRGLKRKRDHAVANGSPRDSGSHKAGVFIGSLLLLLVVIAIVGCFIKAQSDEAEKLSPVKPPSAVNIFSKHS